MPVNALALAAFLMVSSLLLLVYLVIGSGKTRLESRLERLSDRDDSAPDRDSMGGLAHTALPKMGAVLMPKDEGERTKLQARMIHAGLYGREAMVVYLGVKLLLMIGPVLLGLAVGILGLVPLLYSLLGGVCLGIAGMIGPSFWLDRRKKWRQTAFRRAIPDALDVLVICLEGGISLTGALRRVAGELQTAHPLLAAELRIAQREVQLGLPTGDALRQLADRCDLEEMRGLASVINQSERFGASLVKALRVHAETLRTKRLQRAEELAQMAATKVLIPTVLFIMPCVFIVILGPAVIQIFRALAQMGY